jgi:hypothetical protein
MNRRRWLAPMLLVLTIVLFHWKLWLTNQYTWVESPDLAYQVLPWYEFSSYEIHHGRLPLWDPYTYGGQPLHAGMQASLAYPLHWLLLAAPLKSGWLLGLALNWYYILIRCLVALGMYWFCRDLKRSAWASVLAGLIYSLGGVEITTDWPQMAHAAAWAPVVFLFLFRVLRGNGAIRNGALAGGSLGAAWLCGHHAYPAFISLAVVGLWIYWLLAQPRFRWTDLKPPALCFLFAGLVGAAQLLPTIEFGPLARRWAGTDGPLRWNERVPYHLFDPLSLSADGVFSFIFPYTGQNYAPYLGICACGLALLGAALAWREHAVRILSMIGIGGLVYSLSSYTPIHGWLYALVPAIEKTRAPAMATLLVSVAVAALAAYALDYVLSLEKSEWNRRFSVAFAMFGFGILILGSILFARRAEVMNGGNTFLLTGIYAVALALWLAAASNGKLSPSWAAFCPVALVLIELTKGPGSTWRNQMDHSRPNILTPLAEDYKMVQFLNSAHGAWRVETDVPYSFGAWWGIETIDGLVAAATSNILDQDFFSPRFREFMSVRFRVADKPSRGDQRVVFEGPRGLKIFENPTWMPRAWMVHEAVVEKDTKAMSARLVSDGFAPRRQVLLRSRVPGIETCPGQDVVELGRRAPSRVELNVDAACGGVLILNDVYYPGWRVSVDGKPEPLYEAYGVVRGVVVGKGSHTVVFEFSPWSVKLGVLLSLLGLAGIIFTSRRFREQDDVNYG